MGFESINPGTGVLIGSHEVHSADEVERFLASAVLAQGFWGALPVDERALPVRAVAATLRGRVEQLARLMADEMGKPLPQGRAEVEKCAWACEHFAESAADGLRDDILAPDTRVAFRPLGVVLAVMPWNFPLWQVIRFAAPTLMSGNATLVKHAPSVQGCADVLEDVFRAAGLPEGLYANVRIEEEAVAPLIARSEIAAVTLTGSTRAGRAVAAAAGAALKKCVLELGGSDPYLVLRDADVEHAARVCVASRLVNSGQSCVAAKRFLVVEDVREAFTRSVLALMEAVRWGDPLHERGVDVGPLARVDLREALHAQVRASVDAGAELLLGGEVPEGPGAYYPPTLLAGVRPGMAAFDEETFGPVAAIVPVKDEAHGLRLANQTIYGLGAAVFTSNVSHGEQLAEHGLDAGTCVVNDMVVSDPRVPFGGIKASGVGRELGAYGLREFVNVKTLRVGTT